MLQLEEATTGKKRGAYQQRSMTKSKDNVTGSSLDEANQGLLDGYTYSINNYVVKEDWKQYFEYACFSRVPLEWTSIFKEDNDLGEACKLKAEFV